MGTLPELRSSSAGSPPPADLGGDRCGSLAGGAASAGAGVQPAQGARAVGADEGGDHGRVGHPAEPGRSGPGGGPDRRPLPADLPGAGRGGAAEPGGDGDETSWHVNGEMAWLWIMTTEQVAVYGIREGRGYEEAASLLGAEFGGVLVRDGRAIYPKFVKAEHQTCLAHLLRRCREMREVTWGRGREVPNLVSGILEDALELRDRRQRAEVNESELAVGVAELEVRVGKLLAHPAIVHPGNRR